MICIGVFVGISYFLVVFVDDRFHVVHTAVANFDVILAVVFVLFWREWLFVSERMVISPILFDN